MDETVAYMMMGGGEEEGGTVQPTQLVALQTEDGTQQLAVPVIDPATGQVCSVVPVPFLTVFRIRIHLILIRIQSGSGSSPDPGF